MCKFDIKEFMNNFEISLLRIQQDYYRIPVVYNEEGIQRERIFCNELSIQFRAVFGDDYPYKIHSEINKGGHPSFQGELKGIDPDFIVHTPGTHDDNNVVIEVKGNLGDINKIIWDFQKIYYLLVDKKIHYKYGVFLLYNHTIADLKTMISEKLAGIGTDFDDRFFIICSPKSGSIEAKLLSDLR